MAAAAPATPNLVADTNAASPAALALAAKIAPTGRNPLTGDPFISIATALVGAPRASLGEGDTFAPADMSPDELAFQMHQLVGRLVVVEFRAKGAAPCGLWTLLAATVLLSAAPAHIPKG
mgnify:CR=1 FL=1